MILLYSLYTISCILVITSLRCSGRITLDNLFDYINSDIAEKRLNYLLFLSSLGDSCILTLLASFASAESIILEAC